MESHKCFENKVKFVVLKPVKFVVFLIFYTIHEVQRVILFVILLLKFESFIGNFNLNILQKSQSNSKIIIDQKAKHKIFNASKNTVIGVIGIQRKC